MWERVVHLAYEGVPFDERAVTVLELDDTGLISGLRSYYDKLDVLDQIASGSPGIRARWSARWASADAWLPVNSNWFMFSGQTRP